MKKYNVGTCLEKMELIFKDFDIVHLFSHNQKDFNLPVKDLVNLKREAQPLCQEMIDCQLSDY